MNIRKNYKSTPLYRRPFFIVAMLVLLLSICAVVYAQHQRTDVATVKPPAHFPTLQDDQKLYTLDVTALATNRDLYKKNDARVTKLVSQIVKSADKVIAQPLHTVMDKTQTPPSGDKHDYMSLAIYWWPNPDTASGEPYIRKDGKVNPETKEVSDKDYFNTMLDATDKLALAYYFTGNETYAKEAAKQIKTWFVDANTRMNPNLNYAQIIKGKESDGTGLIDLRYVPQVIDYRTLIAPSKALSQEDNDALKKWFGDYGDWLIKSKPGKDQSDSKNNHGTWYDAQLIAISSYIGNKDRAVEYAKRVQKLIETQIMADGTQPLELARTNSWDYSVLNVQGMLQAGIAAKTCDVDVLGYKNERGAGIKKAVDFLAPYAKDKKWTAQQISGFDKKEIANVLPVAQFLYSDTFGLGGDQTQALDPDDTVRLSYPVE